MSSSKKLTCKETLRQVFICLRPRTPTPPFTQCIRVYNRLNSHREGGGSGNLNQREGERGNSSQSWVKNIGVGRLGYRAGKVGRRGILNTSQYLGSLSTDSEKTWQERVSHSSLTNKYLPPLVTFKTRGILCCLLFIIHILCGLV